MLCDAHAHLCDPAFGADLPDVLARARLAGVSRIVAVAETLADAQRNLALARQFRPLVVACAGLFPTYLDQVAANEMETFIRAHRDELVGIGEVGLDHWKITDPGEQELQRAILRRFVALSEELSLPLNVHSRSAGRETIALLLEAGARRVLLHAFDGRAVTAAPAVEAGYFFSVPPSIVRSRQKQKLVRQLPLTCLLLESDSPVLGPEPGLRNEPANVTVALAAVAELQGVPRDSVAEATADNTRRLFG